MTKIFDQHVQILTKKKNGYSNFPTLPQTKNEDENFEILSERENLEIPSIPIMEKNKRVTKHIYFIFMLISF